MFDFRWGFCFVERFHIKFQALILVLFPMASHRSHSVHISASFQHIATTHTSWLVFPIADGVPAVLSAVTGTRRRSVTVLHGLGSQT